MLYDDKEPGKHSALISRDNNKNNQNPESDPNQDQTQNWNTSVHVNTHWGHVSIFFFFVEIQTFYV